MIQANELRIGNWVIDRKTGKYKTIDRLEKSARHIGLDPIPFTSEIYEKIKTDFGHDTQGDFAILFKEGEYWMDGAIVQSSCKGIVRFDYLHQAQNVWFALTGIELNYTP